MLKVATASVSDDTTTESACTPPKMTWPSKPLSKKAVPVKVRVLMSFMTTLDTLGMAEVV